VELPPAAERAERRPSLAPLVVAEDASESLPPVNPELLPLPPEADPEVLAREVPADAIEDPLEEELLDPLDRLPFDELLLPPLETVTVVEPPRPLPDIITDWVALPPRPPRREGAINDTYFSAAVTPVSRSVLAMESVCAGAVRTATTFACRARCCRCCQVQ
jgi:hypothetical protein